MDGPEKNNNPAALLVNAAPYLLADVLLLLAAFWLYPSHAPWTYVLAGASLAPISLYLVTLGTHNKNKAHAFLARSTFNQSLLDTLAEGYALHEAVFDTEGKPVDFIFRDINPEFEQLLGLSRREVIGRKVSEVLPETEPHWLEVFGRVATGGSPEILENYGQSFRRYFQVRVSCPRHGFVAVFFTDITERKESEDFARLAATVFHNTQEAILVIDSERKVVSVNPAFTKITGYHLSEIKGGLPRFHRSGQYDERFFQHIWVSINEQGHWQGEIWNRRKNGELFPAWENISAIQDDSGQVTHYVSVMSDISAVKQAEEHLNHLAHHDILTGLANRLAFSSNLENALERAKRNDRKVALLYLDLDRFKTINDTLGHAAGDLLLKTTADRIKGCVRKEDMVARLGGDEFTVLLEDLQHTETAGTLAGKITRTINAPLKLFEQEVVVSTSIGIGLFPNDAEDADALTRAADAAMYRAKARGRNTFEYYTQDMATGSSLRLAIENALRSALDRNELVLHYQPQFNLAHNQVVGMEALIRWHHPEWGLLLPFQFLEIAEETGLIDDLGDWVIDTALGQLDHWQKLLGLPLRVSVNLSDRQLVHNHLAETLEYCVHSHSLDPEMLQFSLEITENTLQTSVDVIETLNEIRALGIKVAIDNFGTGYSSLNHLKNLPVDTLKMDQVFLRDLPFDTDHYSIAAAIISIGQSLGLSIIAEGVEFKNQLDFLKLHGCDEAQGFFIGKPFNADDATAFLMQARKNMAFRTH